MILNATHAMEWKARDFALTQALITKPIRLRTFGGRKARLSSLSVITVPMWKRPSIASWSRLTLYAGSGLARSP